MEKKLLKKNVSATVLRSKESQQQELLYPALLIIIQGCLKSRYWNDRHTCCEMDPSPSPWAKPVLWGSANQDYMDHITGLRTINLITLDVCIVKYPLTPETQFAIYLKRATLNIKTKWQRQVKTNFISKFSSIYETSQFQI